MADRYTVVTHIRRFATQGEATWLTAARAQLRADTARTQAALRANEANVKVAAGADRAAAAIRTEAGTTDLLVAGMRDVQAAIVSLTAARERDTAAAIRQEERAKAAAVAGAAATRRQAAEQRAATAASTRASSGAVTATSGGLVASARAGGGAVAGVLGAGVAGFGIASAIKTASTYQAALRDIGAVADLSGKRLTSLGAVIRKVGLETSVGAKAAADAAQELVKGGVGARDLQKGALKASIELARAGDIDTGDAANTIARAISTFKLSGKDASHVADLFANAANATTASVSNLVDSFQQGASAARAAGFDIDDTATALAVMAKNGLQASDAGTSLKSALVQVGGPSKRAKEEIKKLGLEFFDTHGKIKGVAGIAKTLEDNLGSLNHQQQISALKAIAGTDGFRALFALMTTGEKGTRKLAKAVQDEGEAHRISEKKLAGAEGAYKRFAAARQEVALQVAGPILDPLADGLNKLTQYLNDGKVRSELKGFATDLGQVGKAIEDGVVDSLKSGTFQKDVDVLLKSVSTMGHVLTGVLGVIATLNKAFTSLPKGIRDAAAAFLAYGAAARSIGKITGLPIGGSIRGLAGRRGAAAEGAVGSTFIGPRLADGGINSASERANFRQALANDRTLARQRVALAAEATAAEERYALAVRESEAIPSRYRSSPYQSRPTPAQGPFSMGRPVEPTPAFPTPRTAAERARQGLQPLPPTTGTNPLLARARQEALDRERALAEEERNRTRQRLEDSPGRRSRLSALGRALPRPTAGGAATAAVAGAFGVATSGGNLGQAALSGASAGLIAGPWGAAGGALAAVAGTELVKFFHGKGVEAARKMGEAAAEEISNGLGKNLSRAAQKTLTDLKVAANKASKNLQDEQNSGVNGSPGQIDQKTQAQYDKTQNTLGKAAGNLFVSNAKSKRFVDTKSLATDLVRRTQDETAAAQRAASQPAIAYVRALERSGKLTKGATDRFVKSIGKKIDVDQKTSVHTQLRVDLKNDGGKARKDLIAQIRKNQTLDVDIKVPTRADLDIEKVLSTAKEQKAALDKIATDDSKGKKEREAARKASDKLKSTIHDFAVATAADQRRATKADLEATLTRIDNANKERSAKQKLLDTQLDLNTAITNQPSGPSSDSGDSSTPGVPSNIFGFPTGRTGGRFGRFGKYATGGQVTPAWVSPGEEIFSPGGRSLGLIPGSPVAADNVLAMLPVDGTVMTGHGQHLMHMGMSLDQARRHQLPHFATGGGIGPARTGQVASQHGFSGNNLKIAIAVAGAESRWTPGATNLNSNGSVDRGLWQINSIHSQYDAQRLFEPGYNAKAAWEISSHGQNWKPWVTYNTGAYRSFLGSAGTAAGKVSGGHGTFSDSTSKVPTLVGASKYGVDPSIPDAFSSAFSAAAAGTDSRPFGNKPVIAKSAAQVYRDAMSSFTKEVTASGGGTDASSSGGSSGKKGIGSWNGRPVANWILPALRYAKKHGAPTDITSGYRTQAQQDAIRARDSRAAKVSEHSGTQYPHGAIDFGGFVDPAALAKKTRFLNTLKGGYQGRMLRMPAGFKDDGHLSGTGHRRGGPIRRYRGGGQIRRYVTGGTVGTTRKAQQVYTKEGPLSSQLKAAGIPAKYDPGPFSEVYHPNAALNNATLKPDHTQAYLTALADAVDGATTAYILKIRKDLQAQANKAQTAASRANFQAALSVIDDRLGNRAGQLVAHANATVSRRDHNLNAVQQIERIAGRDPNDILSIQRQIGVTNDFLSRAGQSRKELVQAQAIAKKRKDPEAYAAATQALSDFDDQVQESRASLGDLNKALQDARLTFSENVTSGYQTYASYTVDSGDDAQGYRMQEADLRNRAWAAHQAGQEDQRYLLDAQAAGAARDAQRAQRRVGLGENDTALALDQVDVNPATGDLTPAARQNYLADLNARQGLLQNALADAQANGDGEDVQSIASELAGIKQAIYSQTQQQAAEAKEAQSTLADLTQQLIDEQQRTQRLIQSQDLASILAGVVSGQIGSSITAQSGFPTPVRY